MHDGKQLKLKDSWIFSDYVSVYTLKKQMIMNSKLTQGIVKPMTEMSIIIVGLSPVWAAMFAWVMQGMKHVLQQTSFWNFQKT